MPETSVSRRLQCLIEGEYIVFLVTVGRDCEVCDLKEEIAKQRELDTIDPDTLVLWKPNDSNPVTAKPSDTLVERIRSLGDNFSNKLNPWNNLFSIFPKQPPSEHLHIIVKLPATLVDETLDAHEPGLTRVASRNPFRKIGPPANMAKFILLRHKIQTFKFNRKRRSSSHVRQPPRPYNISTTRLKIRLGKFSGGMQVH